MIPVVYPPYEHKIRSQQGKDFILDPIRKTWVRLNPEEWVRQNFIRFLLGCGYPAPLLSVEKEIELNGLRKRYDLVVYREGQPWMIVECKDSSVALNGAVLEQVIRYNMAVPCEYLLVTNGHYTYGWKRGHGGLEELQDMPPYSG